jgi:hypothetical protein
MRKENCLGAQSKGGLQSTVRIGQVVIEHERVTVYSLSNKVYISSVFFS